MKFGGRNSPNLQRKRKEKNWVLLQQLKNDGGAVLKIGAIVKSIFLLLFLCLFWGLIYSTKTLSLEAYPQCINNPIFAAIEERVTSFDDFCRQF